MTAVLAATQDLLTSLDPLPYRQRMRHLAAWAATAPDRAQVCAELRDRDPYERNLALVAAIVARDAAGITAATTDPQSSIRVVARRAALRAGLPTGSCADLSAMERRRIYRTLRRLRSPEAAEAVLAEVRSAFGDGEAAAVLPACGPATVRALLPELEHALDLGVLVRRHAGAVLDRVGDRLAAAAPEARDRIWAESAGAALRCDPSGALDLLERYAPGDRLPGGLPAYGILAAHDPDRVARLLTAPGRVSWLRRTPLPPALLRRLASLPTDRLVPLAALVRDRARTMAALLGAVPPARRGDLYDGALAEVETAVLVPAHEIMEVLPAAVRIREATRVLGLEKIRESEAQVLVWSAYLAWPEASAALDVALRSGDADERASAYALLVDAARRSRETPVAAEVVTRLGRLRNEQDPVRAAALTRFAKLARLLTAGTAAGLTALTTDAVEARDASAATTAALSGLAADVLQQHVDVPELREWALLTIDLMSTGAHTPLLRRFDRVLRRGQETMVVDRLRDWVEASAARGWYGPLFALTRALGRRARRVPELQRMLRRAIGPRTLRWATGTTELILDRLTDLGEQPAVIEAAQLLRALGDAGLGAAFARLVERDTADHDPGGPAADRPARRRVEMLARGAVVWSRTRPAEADRSGSVAAARWLADRPGFAGIAAAMLVGLGRLDNLDEIADRCAGRPGMAVRTAERVGARLRELPESIDPAVLRGAVARLVGRGDLAGGLFAVALVRPGAAVGWPAPWRDLLVALRRHPDADVRDEAYAVAMS